MSNEIDDEQYLIKVLSNTAIFSGLKKNHIKNILPFSQNFHFHADRFIFREHDMADGFFVIIQGRVAVLKTSEHLDHDFKKLAELGIGQSFGEIAIIDQSPRSASIKTLEPTQVLKISINHIDRIADIDHLIYTTLLKNIAIDLSRRLRYANEIIALQFHE